MKAPAVAKFRIPILLTLAIAEALGLLHFYGQQGFSQFAVLSLEGMLLTIPLLWVESLRQRGVPSFDILIAILAGICAILQSKLALNEWASGEQTRAQAYAMVTLFIILVILLKLLFPHCGHFGADAITFLSFLVAVTWSWSHRSSVLWIASTALVLLLFAWRITFHLRGWRTKRKINRNLSRIRLLTSEPRTSTAYWRLSPGAILLSLAVFLSFLLLMVLRYWRAGDRVSSIALGAVFLYVGTNAVLRCLRRGQAPGELKEFRDRHMYTLLTISAINVAIFGFVAIRGWQRDGSLFWSGLCWVVSLVDACLSTFMAVMYFRIQKRMGAIATQTTRSN